jgi:hypothetical protein
MILECETRQTRKPGVGGGINIQEQEEEEWRRKSVKSGIGLRSEQAAMDVQLRGNPPHSYGVSRTSIPQVSTRKILQTLWVNFEFVVLKENHVFSLMNTASIKCQSREALVSLPVWSYA